MKTLALVCLAACTSEPNHALKKYIEAINFTVADGAPAIELGDLTSNGQRGPSLSGGTGDVAISGGVAGPNRSQGGPGSSTLGGGVAGGPAVGSVDGSIVTTSR